VRITITEKLIKHDGRQYHGGDSMTVDDELGEYFVKNGWASRADGSTEAKAPAEHVELEVQSTRHAMKAEVK